MNELRRDYFLDRWVILSRERSKRPNDFGANEDCARKDRTASTAVCAFCPGHEEMTPPSKASYFKDGGDLHCLADAAGKPRTGWTVRVIPNLYPAVGPGTPETPGTNTMASTGIHEVIVESPVHDRHPQSMSDEEIKMLFTVYKDRFRAAAGDPGARYISLFRNYGKMGGASLSHAHSQIISLPLVPSLIREQFGLDYGEVVASEAKGPRLIAENAHAIAFAPFAPCYTYETWILPKRRCRNIVELSDGERDSLAILARDVLSKIYRLLDDPPYNYAFVQSIGEDMHMGLRIYPRLGIEAGFELNTRIHINSVSPEDAAQNLRNL